MVYWLIEALKKGDQIDHIFKEKKFMFVPLDIYMYIRIPLIFQIMPAKFWA